MRFARSVSSQRSSGSSQTGTSVPRPRALNRDADVDLAEGRPGVGEQPLDVALDREVGLRDRRAADLVRECACPFLALVVVDENAGTLCGEGPHARRADPTGCARDQHALAVKPRLDAA